LVQQKIRRTIAGIDARETRVRAWAPFGGGEMTGDGFVLVCGLGTVGFRVVELLGRLGVPVRLVTLGAREERLRAVTDRGVEVVRGDARDPALLERAGLKEARALIATSDTDLVNLEIAMDAARIAPGVPVVIRLFDQELARKVEGTFGIRRALAASAVSAPAFMAAALGERWIRSFSLDGAPFVVGECQADDLSPLLGRTVRDVATEHGLVVARLDDASPAPSASIEEGSRLVLVGAEADWKRAPFAQAPPRAPGRRLPRPTAAVRGLLGFVRGAPPLLTGVLAVLLAFFALSVLVFRVALHLSLVDAFYFIVSTVTTTGYGDITPRDASAAVKLYACLVMVLGSATTAVLYSIITDALVTARFQQLLGRRRVPREGHVVVAGLGDVGFRTTLELLGVGVEVAAITLDPAGELVEAARSRTPILSGDARQPDILSRAGLQGADAVLALTGDDAANLGIALAARQLNPAIRTVVRLFDAEFARKAQEAFRLDAALSASRLSAPAFVAAALEPGVYAAFLDGDRFLLSLRTCPGSEWAGLRPSALPGRAGTLVLRAGPKGPWRIPIDDLPIEAEERLALLVPRPLGE
jgi:Trk K+ transport system NAD-binding subunit